MKDDNKLFSLLAIALGLLVAGGVTFFIVYNWLRFERWLNAEPYASFSPDTALEEIALKQLDEYARNGRISSKLRINAECYDSGKTSFLKDSNSVVNVIRGSSCGGFIGSSILVDRDRAERIFILGSSDEGVNRAVRVSCEGRYWDGYEIAVDDETMPKLSTEGQPSCPPERGREDVKPDYDEFVLLENQVLNPKAQIEQIAKEQIQEFFENRQVLSQLSFENACFKGWTEFSTSGEQVSNIIAAKDCFGLKLQSYIHRIVLDTNVNWIANRNYADKAEDWKHYWAAYISAEEITCIGAYDLPPSKALWMTNFPNYPPGKLDSFESRCLNEFDHKVALPKRRKHRFELEDEPLDPTLPPLPFKW